MENKKMVPEIRFSGFTDPWEQRKLDDITDVRDGTHDSPQYLEVGHPFVTSKNVKDGFINYEDIQYISDQDFEEINKRSKVDKNDILMGMIGTIGNIALVREVPDFAIKNIALIKDIGDIFYHYLYHCLQSNSVVHQLDENLDGGTQKFIALNKIRELVIPVPSEYEQHKIGECMGLLDNIITLHQRNLEKLKTFKKAMLDKMFPKNGELVPEIRFSGFTDPWEQRKVTELGKIYIGLVTTMTKHYTNEGTLLIRNSDIKDYGFEFGDNPIYLENTFAQENESRMHNIGDVITVHTGDVGTSAVITENEAKSIGFATIVTRPNIQIITSNYLCTFLNTDKHKRWAVAISTGDGRTNYNLGDYYELVVPIPPIREQQLISSFVQNVNYLITLHQRKLEKLQNIKKSMLNKMFI